MTGQLIYCGQDGKIKAVGGHPVPEGLKNLPNKFTHIIFKFTDGSFLFYNDLRKFGWVKLVDSRQLLVVRREYGLEPLAKEFTLDKFKEILKKYPRRRIKQFLMDQKLIAGIGNIYADESCFYAKIKPTRIVESLTDKERKDLFSGIKKILRSAIVKGGTTFSDYVHTDGTKGGFVAYLKVYGRGGQQCKRCRGKIEKINLNGRGTHYCDRCQK